MKKITLLALLLVLVSALAGCGKNNEDTDVMQSTEVPVATEQVQDAEKVDATATPTEAATEKPVVTKKPTANPTSNPTEKPVVTQSPTETVKPVETQTATQKPVDNRSLSEILNSIVGGLADLPMLMEMELDESNFEAYTFASYVKGAEAVVSEPMMGSFAHSVVLVRLPEGADIKKFANEVKSNADPRKWICVEAEKVQVSTKDNMVLLVMSSNDVANTVTNKFLK